MPSYTRYVVTNISLGTITCFAILVRITLKSSFDVPVSQRVQVITEALPKSVGPNLIGLVTSRDEIPDLLKVYPLFPTVAHQAYLFYFMKFFNVFGSFCVNGS